MRNTGFTVKYSSASIEDICENLDKRKNDIQGAINDAKTLYKYKCVSKEWYEFHTLVLENYKKEHNI